MIWAHVCVDTMRIRFLYGGGDGGVYAASGAVGNTSTLSSNSYTAT
jgi:hypothetical protein